MTCLNFTRWGLLCLLAVLTSFAAAVRAEETPLRVMSFNIRYANAGDGAHAWPHRRQQVADLVHQQKIDSAGLQEVLKQQRDDLVKDLPEYDYVGVGRDDGAKRGEFAPIFYRRDRLKVLDSGTYWLSDNPEKVGSRGWDAALPRIATWAKFEDKQTGATWYHVNTHFDHQGSKAREESARLILERVRQLPAELPVVLTGDLNVVEQSAPYRVLVPGDAASDGRVLHDARYASRAPHEGPTTTWNAFHEGVPNQKIDFILFSGPVRVLHHRVLEARQEGIFASDHFPVVAELVLDSK